MDHFYDGQIRRYLSQMIRMLSGIKYKAGDGKLITVPVMYGDMTRQVANLLKDNSENKMPSAPRIAVYISNLQMDKTRLSDATFVSKVHIRERDTEIVNEAGEDVEYYNSKQGLNYTVERLMPTPYLLTLKADIWASNTDQKLQILEQLMMLFNPSLEIQTTDNYIDWTSISVVYLTDIIWSSRTIPQGIDSEIDISTLTFETPIWISAPTKVKKLGVITDVIMNVFDGLDFSSLAGTSMVNIGNFDILVQDGHVSILDYKTAIQTIFSEEELDSIILKYGPDLNWNILFDQYPGKFKAGISQIFLKQTNGNEIVGTLAVHPSDPAFLVVNYDKDTFPSDTYIDSEGLRLGEPGFNQAAAQRTVTAIIDPLRFNPRPNIETPPTLGTRYLLLEDIGDIINADGADAWAEWDISVPGNPKKMSDFVAHANDIIEYNGEKWVVIFDSQNDSRLTHITNSRTGVQYKWSDNEWTKSVDGEYSQGNWRLIL